MLGEGKGSATLTLIDEMTAAGNFTADWNYYNMGASTKGKMQLARTDRRDKDGNVSNVRYTLSAEFTVTPTAKGGITLESGGRLNQMMKLYQGEAGGNAGKGSFEIDAEVSDQPCRSLE